MGNQSLLDVGSGSSLRCGHTHQVQSPASMEGYFPATLRPTPGLCSLLTCFIFFFKRKVFSSHAGKSNYAVTAVGWLGHNTTCQFSVAYTGAQKLLGIVLKSGIHFSHVNSYNCAKLDEIWLLHTLGKVGHWERQAFFFFLAVTSSLPLPRDEECPQISQEHNFVFTRLWQSDSQRPELCCAAKRPRKYRWHNAFSPLLPTDLCQMCEYW